MSSSPPPPELERAARIANVPEALRSFLRRVGPLHVELELGTDAQQRAAVAQLYKLASLEPESLSLRVLRTVGPCRLSCERQERRFETAEDGLDSIEALVEALASALCSPRELTKAAVTASAELARARALREVAGRMLGAPSVDEALAVFLAGVTSGSGLGFHRAAIFTRDPVSGAFHGALGAGPIDAEEAHRIWESLEAEAVPFETQLAKASGPSRFTERVRGASLAADAGNASVLRLAAAGRGPVFRREDVGCPEALLQLGPAEEFALVELRARDHVLGLLYADRRFGDPSIDLGTAEALRGYVEQASLVWETLRLLREVEDLARYDLLTGLLNRREFELRFGQERARTRRGTSSLSLLLIDLDHFRDVNNERGHEAGDEMLRAIGRVLRAELRANDVAARFGGDELVVLLPDTSPDEAAPVARRVGRRAMREQVPLSLGAASYPDDCTDPAQLVSTADARLYEAKRAGRGRGYVGSEPKPLVFDVD